MVESHKKARIRGLFALRTNLGLACATDCTSFNAVFTGIEEGTCRTRDTRHAGWASLCGGITACGTCWQVIGVGVA